MGFIGIDEEPIPLILEETRKHCDGMRLFALRHRLNL